MQNLLSSLPADPSPIAVPTLPVAAPVAPGAGTSDQPFCMVLAQLNPPTLDPAGQPAPIPSDGAPLPIDRPKLAGPLPPEAPIEGPAVAVDPDLPVETVMIGAKPLPTPVAATPAPPKAAADPVPPEAETGLPKLPAAPTPPLERAAPFPAKQPWVLRNSSALTPPVRPSDPAIAPAVATPSPVVTATEKPTIAGPKVRNDPARAVIEEEADELAAFAPIVTFDPAPLPAPPMAFDPTVWIAPVTVPGATPPTEARAADSGAAPVVVFPRASAPVLATPIEAKPGLVQPPQDVSSLDPALPPLVTPGLEAPQSAAQPSFTPDLLRQVSRLIQSATETAPVASSTMPTDVLDPAAPAMPSMQPSPVIPAAAPAATPVSFQPQPAPIDLGRAEWMQAMIERIAEMPQVDGRREAQIRLLPDMLGAIEVKIVEREERLHVTLNADTAQARQLLSDHAPRLQELAEARGLRFAQTDIGGSQSQDRRQTAEQQPQTPSRPRSASAGPDAEPQPDGERIA